MSLLNERQIIRLLINGDIVISPLIDPVRQIGATSVDIRLGFEFCSFNVTTNTHLDALKPKEELESELKHYTNQIYVGPTEQLVLHPGEFVLASSLEYFRLSSTVAGRLEGRSSWGRLGLQIHSTAGFVDPGFEGKLTFELQNMGKGPICLFPGLRIGQLCLYQIQETLIPYRTKLGEKYGGRMGVGYSRFYEDTEFGILREFKRSSEQRCE